MKLPIPELFGKKETSEYYLSLLLRDEKASAVVIEEDLGRIKIISEATEPFTTSIEDASTDELLDVVDRAVSRAEETLPANVPVQKTLFGVKEEWVEEKKIKKEYLLKLKKLSDELELSPIGFLVIPEAIAHLIQQEEGAPVSAILAEIGKRYITLSLFRGGKNIESKSSPIEESIPKTVDSILKHFTSVEVLPSRMVLLNGDDAEQLAQMFITHQWSKSLPFLHVPQISVLPVGFDAKSIVFGAATQMGFDILPSTSKETIKTFDSEQESKETKKDDEKKIEIKEVNKPSGEEDMQNEEKKETEDTHEKNDEGKSQDKLQELPADNFGFVMDKDIVESADVPKDASEKQNRDDKDNDVNHHGFVINDPHKKHLAQNDDETAIKHQSPSRLERTREGSRSFALSAFGGLVSLLFSLPRRIPRPSLSGISLLAGNKLLFIPPVIILLLIGMALLYITKLGATVTLEIEPKSATQSEEITFSATSPDDFSQHIIAAKDVSVTLDGEVSTNATGEKETGNKAKGTITIFNSSENKRQLSEGAVVTASNGQEFTLDKDVTIASASGDIFSGIKSGTAQAAVTAKDIGTEYNLPSGTKFTIEKSTSLAAKNDAAFTGGSKKKIIVVAKKDHDDLSKKLIGQLESKAREELAGKADANSTILPIFTASSTEKESFDKKVGDEAKTVKLKGSVSFASLSYSDDDLLQFAQTILKTKYTQDVNIPENRIQMQVDDAEKKDDGEVTAIVRISAGILPRLDTAQIAQDITGKSFADAEASLKRLPQVKTIKIQLSPNIPFLPKMLPKMSKNITVVATPQ